MLPYHMHCESWVNSHSSGTSLGAAPQKTLGGTAPKGGLRMVADQTLEHNAEA